MHKDRTDVCFRSGILAAEARLCHFDIPIAELRPDEIVNLLCGKVQVKRIKVARHFLCDGVQAVENPLVRHVKRGAVDLARRFFAQVHQHKARGVINLVAEVARRFHLLAVKAHVVSRAVAGDEAEAQRIRAVILDDLQRVDAVAKGFGHLPSKLVAHDAVDVNRAEGLLLHHLFAEHDHACHPEEDDIIARHKRCGRVKILERLRLLRPAERGERPHAA